MGKAEKITTASLPRYIGLINFAFIESLRIFNERFKIRSLLTNVLLPYHAGTLLHSIEVGLFSVKIGQAMGLDDQDLTKLARGGVLHDIGKIGVPLSILDKPDILTDEEKRIMNRHTELGAAILKQAGLSKFSSFAKEHHNGNSRLGNGNKVIKRLDPLTEITAIADEIAAARDENRKYKNGRGESIEEARESIVEKGRKGVYSQKAVDAFMSIPDEEFPSYKYYLKADMVDFFIKYLDVKTYVQIMGDQRMQ